MRGPGKCVDCGRYARTVCLRCSGPLCEEHATFPQCADCETETHREALIDEVQKGREEKRWRSRFD